DQERFVPLKEDLFAKSGQLLKRVTMEDIAQIGGRWYPRKMNYKDMLKDGKGTDFIVSKIEFNAPISEHLFSKAVLKK
ncbi:MAG: outer membrane lipoprotein-sorting protein, partial [Maribacter sp.]|nr:outer membrane lipoprotein-sorting protein [Maribacter sp.]